MTLCIEASRGMHHSGKFGDHRYWNCEDFSFLVQHMTSCGHMFKGLCDFRVETSNGKSTTLSNFVPIGLPKVEV